MFNAAVVDVRSVVGGHVIVERAPVVDQAEFAEIGVQRVDGFQDLLNLGWLARGSAGDDEGLDAVEELVTNHYRDDLVEPRRGEVRLDVLVEVHVVASPSVLPLRIHLQSAPDLPQERRKKDGGQLLVYCPQSESVTTEGDGRRDRQVLQRALVLRLSDVLSYEVKHLDWQFEEQAPSMYRAHTRFLRAR